MKTERNDILSVINNTLAEYENDIGQNDIQFARRVYEEGLQKYIDRLTAIGFSNKTCVLDAGCGFGQWSVAMSLTNEYVCSCDVSSLRVDVLSRIASDLGITNIRIKKSSIERLDHSNGTVDSIFCYSVIYLSDIEKALAEFKRVIRRDGLLYISSNGLGWHLHNFDNSPNATDDYDPRTAAVDAIANTINIACGAGRIEGTDQIVPSATMCRWLRKIGFRIIHVGPEGSYPCVSGVNPAPPFFIGEYMGQEAVYEIMCQSI